MDGVLDLSRYGNAIIFTWTWIRLDRFRGLLPSRRYYVGHFWGAFIGADE
jgi:hypothetical protein